MNHTQDIKAELLTLAIIAGKDVSMKGVLEAYMEALSDLDQGRVLVALKDWLKTSKGFPYPADIRAKVMPERDENDDGREVAIIIQKAITNKGYAWNGGVFWNEKKVYQSKGQNFDTFDEAAENEMGSLAHEVVKQFGGWTAICEFNHSTEPGTFQAQIRELSKTISKKALRGELQELPELPAPANETQKLIQTTMKGIS